MPGNVGTRYDVMPISAVPEQTHYVDAGPLSIGIEYRRLNQNVVSASFTQAELDAAGIDLANASDDAGVSLHVCERETKAEYLRFDAFATPHYHYITPGSHNVRVLFDAVAGGDFLKWALERLQRRLPEMLREAGAESLAEQVTPQDVETALPQIRDAVAHAVTASRQVESSAPTGR